MTTQNPTAALYRARFDPPGLHHVAVVKGLLGRFDRVVIRPFGPTATRSIDENIGPVFRARLIDLAFQTLSPRVFVDLDDLENATLTDAATAASASSLSGHEVFHVVEAETLATDVAALRAGARVIVVADEKQEVPDGHPIVRIDADVKGSVMRRRLYDGEPVDGLVPDAVAAVIARHGLYRGEPRSQTRVQFQAPRVVVVKDDRNPKAVAFAKRFERYTVSFDDQPNLIVVIGGDGSMLHAIQTHWRRRVPFFGVNAGHLGFLLNDPQGIVDDDEQVARVLSSMLVLHHMPMLHVDLLGKDGVWRHGLTFNDAWVERSTGQSAWLEIKVDGQVRLPRLVCDGVLVSSAAGSTAYARSMGATPLLADTPAWLVVGSNVMDPIHWKSALLSKESTLEARSLDTSKRPLNGFLHGVSMGEVTAMTCRISRAASVELAFLQAHDMAEKIARIQFPATRAM